MNFTDTLISGVIFGLASCASLQIYASSLRAIGGLEQRREREAAVDLLLAGVHRALIRQSLEQAADAAPMRCEAQAERLQHSLAGLLPVGRPGGVQVQLAAEGSLLRAMAQAPDLPERRRWYSPASYGLCGNAASARP